ncbi:PilX N-terminal domain-containing pilus assembly protein [uncultured Stenotrophomonas sp.]|uniref:pilus assembly PilX family protein n=1 Tax=uncultured Stenotrophomonas sp. TaxID=165438 RepID=UPI0028D682A3|nr:PilX N-terminal domain-containing pilus assembly protein [uncultured Stenotrophomonas sp.]
MKPPRTPKGPYGQRGAVLYVALIMLILLALLGIAGMQVAGMQEKMASNYRAANRAFQNSEGVVRNAERSVENIANRNAAADGALVAEGDINRICDDGYDPVKWAGEVPAGSTSRVNVRQIDKCIVGEAALDMGEALDETTPIYQITGFSTDDPAAVSSAVVIDTVFKL